MICPDIQRNVHCCTVLYCTVLSCCTLSFPVAFCLVLSYPVLQCNQQYYQDNCYYTWIEWNDVLWYDMVRSRTLYCNCTASHPDLFCPAFARSAKLNVDSSICASDQVMSGVDAISLSIYLSIYLPFPLFLSLSLSLPLLHFPAASLSHTIPLLEVTKWI